MKLRAILLAAALLCLAAFCAACTEGASTPEPTSNPASASPCSTSSAATQETPTQAARRLFADEYHMTMRVTERPQVLKGASAGTPWPVARDYSAPGPTVAAWVLSNDASAATSGMFTAMQPTPQRNDYYIVPMVKDGRSVCEFEISRDDRGRWEAVGGLSDPLPGGTVLDAESATRQLREELGTAAEVRFVVFLPSGLIFAVGCNGEREAAVYLTFNNAGPGITTFDKYLPRTGRLFSPDELARLLAP